MTTEIAEDFGVSQGASENELSRNVYVKKFRSLAKEYFELEINSNVDPVQKVKETSRLLSFSLPANLNEIFLRPEESPILWVLSTPINSYLDEYFKLHFAKSSGLEIIKQANESYQKWVFNKSLSEKKYFATTFINLADKKFTNNFWLYLLLASVYLNEKSLVNYNRSVELLEKAREVISTSKLTDSFRDELYYYINIFKGFANLRQNSMMSANENFTEALRINPFGITAKFYLALSEISLNNREVAQHLLAEILNYDNFRCMHAVGSSNAGMLHFFVHYPLIQNIFYYNEFSFVANIFESELEGLKINYDDSYQILNQKIVKLEALQMMDYINPDTSRLITFAAQVLSILSKSKSVLFYKVFPEVEANFIQAMKNIREGIKTKYYNDVKERLLSYNDKIENNLDDIERIKDEQEDYIHKLKERLKEAVEKVETDAAEDIAFVESRINNIPNVKNLSPRHSFSKAMIFNVIISFLVFMMGGCSGYTESFMFNVWEFKEVAAMIILAGLKWGGISFLIGVLVSFIAAAYVVLERSNEKQRLIKRISRIKEQKNIDIDMLNKDFVLSEKSINSSFGKRIADKNGEIKLLAEEKERREKAYTEEADAKIEEEMKKIEEIDSDKERPI